MQPLEDFVDFCRLLFPVLFFQDDADFYEFFLCDFVFLFSLMLEKFMFPFVALLLSVDAL